jgi:hypothetical protein
MNAAPSHPHSKARSSQAPAGATRLVPIAAAAVLALVCGAPAALADITTAKINVRGEPTKSATNRISVKTGDQEEIASIYRSQDAPPQESCERRAAAITSQMTRVTAECLTDTAGASVIKITALDGRKITGIDHNGLNGEEITVNPQSLLYTNTKLTCVGVAQADGQLAMFYPQAGGGAQMFIPAGMPADQVNNLLIQQFMMQGFLVRRVDDGFWLDNVPVGSADPAADPFLTGAVFRYTGQGLNFHAEYFWTVPPGCGSVDFNGDGDIGTDADIEAFFACLGGDCCSTCGSADFDNDGDLGTDADIEAFFRVLGGGEC